MVQKYWKFELSSDRIGHRREVRNKNCDKCLIILLTLQKYHLVSVCNTFDYTEYFTTDHPLKEDYMCVLKCII